MENLLKGENVASMVLRASQGASVKYRYKIDTYKFSWVDDFLRDAALRKKIEGIREKIKETRGSLIDKGELRKMFESAISSINTSHIDWFVESLKAVQLRTGHMVNSDTVRGKAYSPSINLSKKDIDNIFIQLPEGVTQANIDAEVEKLLEEIRKIETVIESELSPRDRWMYRDDGKPVPYPQGCRWTQYVTAWRIIVKRYDGPVTIEGLPVNSDEELIAYRALGLHELMKITPLRKPGF